VDQKIGTPSVPGLPALDEFRREAVPMEGGSGGETGYTAADHQDRSDLCHIPSDRGATPPPLERLVASTTADLGT
jgi:hypothetical protein